MFDSLAQFRQNTQVLLIDHQAINQPLIEVRNTHYITAITRHLHHGIRRAFHGFAIN